MNKRRLALIVVVLLGCSDEPTDPWYGFVPFDSHYDVEALVTTTQFSTLGISKGEVTLNEASGIVTSRVNPSSLWAHDDSGNPNHIYLLDQTTAQTKATYRINGIVNTDWEDIAIGPGDKIGQVYIYLADIGDNTSTRDFVQVFIFPEPIFIESHRGKIKDYFPEVKTLQITYPDGPHDAETIMVDPTTKDIYIITKYGERSKLYVARYPQAMDSAILLTEVGSFPFREVVAGDISSNGNEVLIKNYERIFYWKNTNDLPIWRLLSTVPQLAPYNPIEAQGEAICFTDGSYFTLSEQYRDGIPKLYFYNRN